MKGLIFIEFELPFGQSFFYPINNLLEILAAHVQWRISLNPNFLFMTQ